MTNEQAPAKATTHMVIAFIGLLAVMLTGGVIYFVCTNATAFTSNQPSTASQWVLPVLISFASIPLTALVTMSTVRSRGDDTTASTTTTTETTATPPVEPPTPEPIQPLMMSGPAAAMNPDQTAPHPDTVTVTHDDVAGFKRA